MAAAPGDGTAKQATGLRTAGNPFAGAKFYVNPDYARTVLAASVKLAGDDRTRAQAVAKQPTGVWLDRIAAIAGGTANGGRLGLAGHLDAALQQAEGAEIVLPLVVYNLPARDCRSAASSGELGLGDLGRYKAEFIDAIANIIASKPSYQKVRVVVMLEPDSLPNLVTNLGIAACAKVAAADLYVQGISYAVTKFKALANVYIYLDMANAGWFGWPQQVDQAVDLYAKLIGDLGGTGLVRGLATNIANYVPEFELEGASDPQTDPFYVKSSLDTELAYNAALFFAFNKRGLSALRLIMDTSRNGWPYHPKERYDRRLARDNWCNIGGSGVGMRPQANPRQIIFEDAYLWAKPPGESDGYGSLQNANNAPDAEGKRFDPDCDAAAPAHQDSVAGAPAAGHWFPEQFLGLLRNATPKL